MPQPDTLQLHPDYRHPAPKPREPHELEDMRTRAKAAFNTAEFLKAFGLPINITDEDREEARAIFMDTPNAPAAPTTPGAAYILEALLTKYDFTMIGQTNKMRNYVLFNLFNLAENAESDSVKLKSIELLGKVAEVGLFANKIEISIEQKSTIDLEADLKALLKSYDLDALEGELADVQDQLSLEREARGELTDEELRGNE